MSILEKSKKLEIIREKPEEMQRDKKNTLDVPKGWKYNYCKCLHRFRTVNAETAYNVILKLCKHRNGGWENEFEFKARKRVQV